MKKLIPILTILTLSSTAFSYTLTTTDRALVDSFEPKIEVMMEEENDKFMKIIDKLDVLLPAFDTDTRIYGVLDYLQQTMIQMIPEEPTVIQELNLEGLFGELLDEDEHDSVGIAGSAMNQGEMQNADEKKLDLGDNETDQIGQESENSELDSEEDEQQEQELNEVEQRHLLRQQQKDEYEQERLEYHKQEYEKRHAGKQYFYEFN